MGRLLPAHPPLIIGLEIESCWRGGGASFLCLHGGRREGRFANKCGRLADHLQRDPHLRRPPGRCPQAAELAALHPFLQAAQDLEARGWAAQEEAEEAADVTDVLVAAMCPLQVHTDAGRGMVVDVSDQKRN